jgi:hypothetical protein
MAQSFDSFSSDSILTIGPRVPLEPAECLPFKLRMTSVSIFSRAIDVSACD